MPSASFRLNISLDGLAQLIILGGESMFDRVEPRPYNIPFICDSF